MTQTLVHLENQCKGKSVQGKMTQFLDHFGARENNSNYITWCKRRLVQGKLTQSLDHLVQGKIIVLRKFESFFLALIFPCTKWSRD